MRQTTRWLLQPLLVRSTPKEIASGLTLGLVIGVLPKDNLLAIGMMAIGLFLPLNIGMGIAACVVGCFCGPWLDRFTDPIGQQLLMSQSLQPTWSWISDQPILPWLGLHNSVVLGSLCLLAPGAIVLYGISHQILRAIHRLAIQYKVDSMVSQATQYKRSLGILRRERRSPQSEPIMQEADQVGGRVLEDFIQPGWKNNLGIRIDDAETPVPFHDIVPQPTRESPSHESPSRGSVSRESVSRESIVHSSETSATRLSGTEIRIDPGMEVGLPAPGQIPQGTEVTAETSNTPSHHFSIGDVLKETLIEVVRFKPSDEKRDGGPRLLFQESAKTKSLAPSLSVNVPSPAVPPAHEATVTRVSVSNQEAPSLMTVNASPVSVPKPMTKKAEPSVSETEVVTTNSNEPAPTQPAEESLRYLLWHLSSLNRESKR